MGNKLVSVIIPTYARPDNLIRAIDSVLLQTYSPIEIIVVDDNGQGTPWQIETEKLLQPYINNQQITYIKHEINKNGSAARNTGTRASHGEIIGYLDDDDVFLQNKIEKQVRRLEEVHSVDSSYAAVYCNIEMKNYGKRDYCLMSSLEGNLTEELLLSEVRFNSSTILMYRNAFDEINGWDERFQRMQDWEFCVRFFRKYNIAQTSKTEILVRKYNTPNYVSANPQKLAFHILFFINEMKNDINKLSRGNEVLGYRYFILSCRFLMFRRYRDGLLYLKYAYKYFPSRIRYSRLFKSVINGLIGRYE